MAEAREDHHQDRIDGGECDAPRVQAELEVGVAARELEADQGQDARKQEDGNHQQERRQLGAEVDAARRRHRIDDLVQLERAFLPDQLTAEEDDHDQQDDRVPALDRLEHEVGAGMDRHPEEVPGGARVLDEDEEPEREDAEKRPVPQDGRCLAPDLANELDEDGHAARTPGGSPAPAPGTSPRPAKGLRSHPASGRGRFRTRDGSKVTTERPSAESPRPSQRIRFQSRVPPISGVAVFSSATVQYLRAPPSAVTPNGSSSCPIHCGLEAGSRQAGGRADREEGDDAEVGRKRAPRPARQGVERRAECHERRDDQHAQTERERRQPERPHPCRIEPGHEACLPPGLRRPPGTRACRPPSFPRTARSGSRIARSASRRRARRSAGRSPARLRWRRTRSSGRGRA